MKICHCIQLTQQEKTAIDIVGGILHEMAEDDMIHSDFERTCDGELDDISAWFDNVADYLGSFGD